MLAERNIVEISEKEIRLHDENKIEKNRSGINRKGLCDCLLVVFLYFEFIFIDSYPFSFVWKYYKVIKAQII